MRPVWLWWSSGKDSAWALHALRGAGTPVGALVVTVNRAFDRVAMHAVRAELVRRQAEAAGLPLHVVEIPNPCSNDEYEAAFAGAVAAARAAGAGGMAFGDLFLADVRAYRERLLAGSGLDAVFPLWGRDTRALAAEMLAGGLRAVLTCVDPKQVPAALAGRSFDAALLAELPPSADPCGERGEFHTFAWDGPMFREPVTVTVGERVERDGFVFADVVPAAYAIRALDRVRDRAELRALFVELQDASRALDPAEPAGDAVADAYLPLLFQRCDDWRGQVFVAERDGRLAGFVGVLSHWPQEEPDEPYASFAYVSDLVVLPEARRAGVGRALLDRAEAFARAEGAAVLRIDVVAQNAAARSLYSRFGFRERTLEMEKVLDPDADVSPPGGGSRAE
jgi:uncharacterized protein (TIGR00290 family)